MASKRKADEIENDESDPVISLQDVIEEDEELETTADAVLGGSDDKECTYPQGYVQRQALYACQTCSGSSGNAGVCLACSLECHEGHELFELYTKRNFRCDCGNDKFDSAFTCRLCPAKDCVNEDNAYNHNFKGSYCTCNRPYPDPDDSVDDEMIQCVLCEDWFHGRHLKGAGPPADSDYEEMICQLCMSADAGFLWPYHIELAVQNKNLTENKMPEISDTKNVKIEVGVKSASVSEKGDQNVDVNPTKDKYKATDMPLSAKDGRLSQEADCNVDIVTVKAEEQNPEVSIAMKDDSSPAKTIRACELQRLKDKHGSHIEESATFWPEGWRLHLCRCSDCEKTLKDKNMTFLLCYDDSVTAYEKKGKSKSPRPKIGVMDALGGMNRVQQVELIHGYNDLKSKLSEYLRTFAEQGKVVTESDIKAFFQRMSDQKRQKTVIPRFCK